MHPAVAGQTEVSSRAVDRRFARGAASFRSGLRIWTQRPVWAAACESDQQVAWAMFRSRSDYPLRAQAHAMARWPGRFTGLITMAGLLELDHRASYTPCPSSQRRMPWRHGTPRLCSRLCGAPPGCAFAARPGDTTRIKLRGTQGRSRPAPQPSDMGGDTQPDRNPLKCACTSRRRGCAGKSTLPKSSGSTGLSNAV